MNSITRLKAIEEAAAEFQASEFCVACRAPHRRSDIRNIDGQKDIGGVCPDCRRLLDHEGRAFGGGTNLHLLVLSEHPAADSPLIDNGAEGGFTWRADGKPAYLDAQKLTIITQDMYESMFC